VLLNTDNAPQNLVGAPPSQRSVANSRAGRVFAVERLLQSIGIQKIFDRTFSGLSNGVQHDRVRLTVNELFLFNEGPLVC
jgi:hypothetical protein